MYRTPRPKPRKPKRNSKHGDRINAGRYMRAHYERNPMIFLITKAYSPRVIESFDDLIDVEPDAFMWTLHRKVKNEVGEPICRSVETWLTERQCRAAINTAKRAMSGVRFAQTQVQEDDA